MHPKCVSLTFELLYLKHIKLCSQDLPDNIQVGGRISPQIVWDYVEKIRASGTKVGMIYPLICLILHLTI